VLTNFTAQLDKRYAADTDLAADRALGKVTKPWDSLPDVQKWIIRNASTYENPDFTGEEDCTEPEFIIPDKPTGDLMNILKCTTQARVQIYLHTHPLFQDCMVYIDMESCAAMKQGIFLANEGVEDVSNYGPHFCGTQSMKQTRNNFLLLELKATHRQMTQEDLVNATTQTIQYPVTHHELCDFMKNYSNVNNINFGARSIFGKSGVEIVRQLNRHVKDWNNCFKQFKDFGAFFITQIGIRHQRFLASCAN